MKIEDMPRVKFLCDRIDHLKSALDAPWYDYFIKIGSLSLHHAVTEQELQPILAEIQKVIQADVERTEENLRLLGVQL